MPSYVRLMRREDITQVAEIDREAFPTMWPVVNYERELDNHLAHYTVACDDEVRVEGPQAAVPAGKDLPGLRSRVRRLLGRSRFLGHDLPQSGSQYVTGFAGFWIMAGEAHIISIAVREHYHRQGIGELLLISVIDLATELGASIITLEVRASNTIAQSLYRKYGFTQVGLRHNYYIDNKEDAVIMTTENITSASFQANLKQLRQAHSQRWGIALSPVVR